MKKMIVIIICSLMLCGCAVGDFIANMLNEETELIKHVTNDVDTAINGYEIVDGTLYFTKVLEAKVQQEIPWAKNTYKIEKIVVEEGVTVIDGEVFADCYNLKEITLPDTLLSICYAAFSGCTALSSITIPDSVTDIGSDAFSGCTALSSIIIPGSVKKLKEMPFQTVRI